MLLGSWHNRERFDLRWRDVSFCQAEEIEASARLKYAGEDWAACLSPGDVLQGISKMGRNVVVGRRFYSMFLVSQVQSWMEAAAFVEAERLGMVNCRCG